jgi:hypothetical protein
MPPAQIDELRLKLDSLGLRGKSAVHFKGLPVMDRAFFPGGNGLFLGNGADIPIGGVLVLGSNFGCVTDFVRENGALVRRDETQSSNTWKGLYRLFTRQTGIDLIECFSRMPGLSCTKEIATKRKA